MVGFGIDSAENAARERAELNEHRSENRRGRSVQLDDRREATGTHEQRCAIVSMRWSEIERLCRLQEGRVCLEMRSQTRA